MSKKKAKFFCENCGSEVDKNAKFCDKCGRFFASVRCPSCGYTGSNNEFTHGCPKCGYADKSKATDNDYSSFPKYKWAPKNHFYIHGKAKSHSTNGVKQKSSYSNSTLPLWIYISTISALLVVIGLIIRCS